MAPVSRNVQNNDSANVSNSSSKSSRWFNTSILGKAVEALQEEELAHEGTIDSADAEEALEVNEEVTLDDRYLPLAFSSVRHLEEIVGLDIGQVGH